MSLREEMKETVANDDLRETSGHGRFSRWWYFDLLGNERGGSSTFIRHMLDTISSDEELERLWAQWNIERES